MRWPFLCQYFRRKGEGGGGGSGRILAPRPSKGPYRNSARTQGVFKNARGWLRGWELHEDELKRLETMSEPEIVLVRRPRYLYIELEAPTPELPLTDGKPIFKVSVQVRVWSLDTTGTVKILRYGFNLVPDFGGTAHAYCGSTLDACIGDLLSWHQRPRREDALKAYIIKSRVRDADRLLIAQPYCPQLFRQGVHPGPHLLHQVLTKEMSWEEAGSSSNFCPENWIWRGEKRREFSRMMGPPRVTQGGGKFQG